jgi:2-amino-4-hydroxy-6-hydroxymethyldihydropteridine diphosphokinase
MSNAYLLLGSNLGNRLQYLQQASVFTEQLCGAIIQWSAIYETEAWGIKEQNSFLNQAIQIQTLLEPQKLMQTLLSIEEKLGRKRIQKLGPRIIDIDILLLNDEVIKTPSLKVPHPYLPERRFALTPLAEIAGEIIHPILKESIKQLLIKCTDESDVYKIAQHS